MSSLKFHFPQGRLAAALKAARPRPVDEALKAAESNLGKIAGECAEHVEAAVAGLELLLSCWPAEPDEAYLLTFYQAAARIIGVASVAHLPDLDRAAHSLCDVLDGQISRSLWQREPIAVHVGTLRLLLHPAALGPGIGEVLNGLARVRTRFAVEEAGGGPAAPEQARSSNRAKG